jgi:hypothetical protein
MQLQPLIAAIPPKMKMVALEALERYVGGYPNDGWGLTRWGRLRRALGQT